MSILDFVGGFMSYQADKAAYKASKAWQKYSNTMARLSNGQNQNAITNNEIQSEEAFAQQAVGIKQEALTTEGATEVSAAAAGVTGRSVNQAMLQVHRNAANAERQRQIDLTNSRLSFDQERRNSAMAAEMSQDYSYIPKPNLGTYMLNAAIKSFDQMQSRR